MLHEIFDHLLHVKDTVDAWSGQPWFPWVLFAVLFAETGLVVTPFLPGDSLLFAVGAVFADQKGALPWVMALMWIAALSGDMVNYSLGRAIGPKVFSSGSSRWLNAKHLAKAQAFYEKYGAKTIVLARFVPIVRTFAPFVAGIGRMKFARFALFSVTGGAAWVVSMTLLGVWFGGIETVRKNFEMVVVGIVVVSVLPIVVEYVKARRAARA